MRVFYSINSRFTRFFLIMLPMIFLIGCNKDDEPKDQTRTINLWISSETTYITAWDGQKEECMLVKFSEDGDWKPLGMRQIEGFDYERGYAYKLEVVETILATPPADGYDRTYKLLRILNQVWEGEVATDNLQRYYIVGNQGGTVEITFAPRDKQQCKLELEPDCSWAHDIAYEITPGKWTISFEVDPNQGLGRASTFNITVGDENYKVGLWQQPREFTETEEFKDCNGRLCILLGSDLENIKRIHNFVFIGSLNANDLGWLRAWLLESWEGPQTKGFLTFDMSDCTLSTSESSENSKFNLPELPDYYKVTMESDNALPQKYFKDLQVVRKVRLSDELVVIGESAFDHCLFLERVNLPARLGKIGSNAFSGCYSLTNISFPYDSEEGRVYPNLYLESIGNNAFMGIGKIEYFILPQSLKSVGNTSLPSKISKLYIMSPTPQECLENTIVPSIEGCTVFVPKGSLEAFRESEKWKKYTLEEMSENSLQGSLN